MSDSPRSPADAYDAAVSDIVASTPRGSSFQPSVAMDLTIVNRRQPRSVDELADEERQQLTAVWGEELAAALSSDESQLEVAEVHDEGGTLRYRLYAWNYGVGFLFAPSGHEMIAFGSQHDLEHWRLTQRDVFHAMDHALRKAGHGFQQPLSFCWWRDECWNEIADEEPGTVGSEPYFRARFAALSDHE